MEPTIDHDDDGASDLSRLGHDPEPTTGAPALAPDAPKTGEPRTAKRRVNDGPTGRARREAAHREGELEGNLEPDEI